MVPINPDHAFPPQAEWVNVYDPTDPVGTWISNFGPIGTGSAVFAVNNFPCRASPILLLSHLSYLSASRLSSLRLIPNTPDLLVNRVAEWLVRGGSLAMQLRNANRRGLSFWIPLQKDDMRPEWQAKARAGWRFAQWVIVDALLTILALLSVHWIVYPIVGRGQPASPNSSLLGRFFNGASASLLLCEAASLWAGMVLLVGIASLIHYWWGSRDLHKLNQSIEEQGAKPLARAAE